MLEMALIQWSTRKLVERGLVPVSPPDLVRSVFVDGCGFQPRTEDDQQPLIYQIRDSDLVLSGTAEIPLAAMLSQQHVMEKTLALKYVAFGRAFRTEAASGAGGANRGLYRVHQFSKVEMFAFTTPETSSAVHEEFVSIQQELFSELGLHFRVLEMPTGDLGAAAHRKVDIEAWMPGKGTYGEISSASNCTDYQSRRLNIRYFNSNQPSSSDSNKQPHKQAYVHTVNGTACAVPRMLVAIFEQFQEADGSIRIPTALQPFCLNWTRVPRTRPPQPASNHGHSVSAGRQ